MKPKTKVYYFMISFIVTLCILQGFLCVCLAYENMARIAYGKDISAVEFTKDGIRILDFKF